jgi:aspartate aminotransferase-like enzyme
VNGYFGLRMAEMARREGADVATIERPWDEVFTADEISDALRSRPARVVAIVHGETSTGALQRLDDVARAVHDADALLILDAVSSLAGVPIRVDELGIDVCYSGTQKCLGCSPGLALSRSVRVLRPGWRDGRPASEPGTWISRSSANTGARSGHITTPPLSRSITLSRRLSV